MRKFYVVRLKYATIKAYYRYTGTSDTTGVEIRTSDGSSKRPR